MNRTTWTGARARGRRWAGLGLLLAIALFGHDLGMVGLAAPSADRLVLSAITSPAIQVVHVAVDAEGSRASQFHHQPAHTEEPAQPQCELARAAVPTAHPLLDTTLLTIPGAIMVGGGWHRLFPAARAADSTVPSARHQRTMFQVFLI